MNIINLKKAFSYDSYAELPNPLSRKRRIIRPLVAKLSLGNVNLQQERYFLESDIDKLRKQVCSYRYID